MSNILEAIINLAKNPVLELSKTYVGNNRANSTGDALEEYVKDLFAGTFNCIDEQERLEKISNTFSYLGNKSNPPDAMLRFGDAIEVKKIESNDSSLALNSSYPKHKLHSDSNMISQDCRDAEQWTEKDMIYCVGIVQKNRLKHLCMVYGLDYCASIDTYEKIKSIIKEGINVIPNIELSDTNELGKLNKVDPLGITYLRVRGMWGIENPFRVFNYVFQRDMSKQFNFMAIINLEKYNTFANKKEFENFVSNDQKLFIKDIKIKNPNNPAQLNEAKLITLIF
jgi:hypothetical protein